MPIIFLLENYSACKYFPIILKYLLKDLNILLIGYEQ